MMYRETLVVSAYRRDDSKGCHLCRPPTIAATFMELAFRYGYRRTAVEDVARELRISKKTIYEYFSSKQDLLRYALELGAREQRARVESLLTETTALGRLQQVVGIALG